MVTYGEYNFFELRNLRYLVRNTSILPNRRQTWWTQKLPLSVALKTTAQPGSPYRVFQISTFWKALRMCWLPNHCLFSSEYPQNGKIYGLNWTFHLFSNMKGTIVFELPRSSHTNTRADFRFIQDRSIPCFAHITLIPMSTIVVTNRKKTSYKNTSKPLTESAPRKRFAWHSVVVALFIASARRRNITTQSCTNCHISKRMVSLSLSYGLEVWLEGLMMSLTVW